MHTYLLDIGFTPSTADQCVYNLDSGVIVLLFYVDGISLSGSGDEQVSKVIEKLKDRFEAVDLGDAKFLLANTPKRVRRNLFFIAGNIL